MIHEELRMAFGFCETSTNIPCYDDCESLSDTESCIPVRYEKRHGGISVPKCTNHMASVRLDVADIPFLQTRHTFL